MNLDHLMRMDALGVAFDTETWRIEMGLLAPPLVCGSAAMVDPAGELTETGARIAGELFDPDGALEVFRALLAGPRIIVLANGAYDLVVMAVHAARRGLDIVPEIYRALRRERVYDILIAEALNAIANGHLGKDPRTGGQIINPETGKRGRYSLATTVDMVLGRKDAKTRDEWRLNYADLDGTPLEHWPENARLYPVDDARNTLEVALAQCGLVPRLSRHEWGKGGRCIHCGNATFSAPCPRRQRHRNLHALAEQVETAFAMQLGAVWGFEVDQDAVDAVEKRVTAGRAEIEKHLVAEGILRTKREKGVDRLAMLQSVVKRMTALAYGAKDPCPRCTGTGKIGSPKNPKAKINCCAWQTDDAGLPIINPATGKVDKTKTCDGTGLVLIPEVPRAKKGGVSIGRDSLSESGDDLLLEVGEYDLNKKTIKTYIPFLRKARRLVGVFAPDAPEVEDDEESEDETDE